MDNGNIKGILILAAGYGSRMKPITLSTPKPMIKIWNEPIIERLLKQLDTIFPTIPITINVSHLSEEIIKFCLKIPIQNRPEIIFEFEPQGTLSSIINYSKKIDGMIAVFHGDLIIDIEGLSNFKKYVDERVDSIIVVHARNLSSARSIIEISNSDKVISVIEIKKSEKVRSVEEFVFSNSGIYFLDSNQIKNFPIKKDESISPILLNWIAKKYSLRAYVWEGRRYSLESINDINEINLIEKFF